MQNHVFLLVGLVILAFLFAQASDNHQELRAVLKRMEKKMADKIDDLAAKLASYFVDLDKYVDEIKGASAAALEAAKNEVGPEEAARLDAIMADIDARHAAIVKPTPPPIEPSNL